MSYFDQFMGLLGFDQERERSQLPPMMTRFQDPLAGQQQPTSQTMANMPFDAMQQMAQQSQQMPTSIASQYESPVVQPEEPSFLDKAGEGLKSLAPSREQALRMAIAFNSMRTNTDPNLTTALTAELKDLREQQKTAGKGGQTAKLIRQMAGSAKDQAEKSRLNSLADATERGLMTGSDALTQAYKRQSMGTTINLAGKASEEKEKHTIKQASTNIEAGQQASMTLGDVDRLMMLGSSEALNQVPDFARGFIPQGFSTAVDAYNAQVTRVAKGLRSKGEGPMSDKDIDLLMAGAGPISASQQAREIAQRGLAGLAQRKVERARIAEAYMADQIDRTTYYQKMAELRDQPLFTDEERDLLNSVIKSNKVPSYDQLPAEAKGRITAEQYEAMPYSGKMTFRTQ